MRDQLTIRERENVGTNGGQRFRLGTVPWLSGTYQIDFPNEPARAE